MGTAADLIRVTAQSELSYPREANEWLHFSFIALI